MDELTVGEVAERFGITIRTLHHYDEIGLLTLSRRAASDYRVYTSADLTRLSQIIVYRRLELFLGEIASVLDEGNEVSHLVRQRERVMSRLDEMKDLVDAIDQALEKAMTNIPMTDDDMRELFGDGFDDYQAEAEASRSTVARRSTRTRTELATDVIGAIRCLSETPGHGSGSVRVNNVLASLHLAVASLCAARDHL